MTMRLTVRRVAADPTQFRAWATSVTALCLVMAGTLPAAWAQARDVGQLLAHCQDATRSADQRLAACTAIVEQKANDEDLRIEALMNRGIVWEEREEIGRAIEDYSLVISLSPANALARFNRGNAYSRLARAAEALADYDKAIELDPKDPDFFINRGLSRAEIGEHERAIGDFGRAIALGPADASIYSARGLSYEKLGRIAEARSDFIKALELAHDDDDARDGLERVNSR